MRSFVALAVTVLVFAACGGGDGDEHADTTSSPPAATTTTANAAPTTTAPSTTTTPVAAATTLTFTGSDCIQSGPDAMSVGFVTITLKNESSVDMAVVVLELVNVTLEELVADNVRLFPPTTVFPPPGAHPKEAHSTATVGSSSEIEHGLAFTSAGDYGTVCWPLDGSPAVQGALLTVEK